MIKKAQDLAICIRKVSQPYEKYIGFLALALVIDHFVLGGSFRNKFKALAEALVGRITEGLNKLIDKIALSPVEDTPEDTEV